jgi:copper chaperone CopZ
MGTEIESDRDMGRHSETIEIGNVISEVEISFKLETRNQKLETASRGPDELSRSFRNH